MYEMQSCLPLRMFVVVVVVGELVVDERQVVVGELVDVQVVVGTSVVESDDLDVAFYVVDSFVDDVAHVAFAQFDVVAADDCNIDYDLDFFDIQHSSTNHKRYSLDLYQQSNQFYVLADLLLHLKIHLETF